MFIKLSVSSEVWRETMEHIGRQVFALYKICASECREEENWNLVSNSGQESTLYLECSYKEHKSLLFSDVLWHTVWNKRKLCYLGMFVILSMQEVKLH